MCRLCTILHDVMRMFSNRMNRCAFLNYAAVFPWRALRTRGHFGFESLVGPSDATSDLLHYTPHWGEWDRVWESRWTRCATWPGMSDCDWEPTGGTPHTPMDPCQASLRAHWLADDRKRCCWNYCFLSVRLFMWLCFGFDPPQSCWLGSDGGRDCLGSAETASVPAFTLWSINNCFNILHAYFSATES